MSLNAKQRRALPDSDFALPGKGKGPEGKGSGSYPIDTEGRARAALARGAANASPAEQKTIERKVHAKYPSMEVKALEGNPAQHFKHEIDGLDKHHSRKR